jgi:putative ABC transport system substrate-binding protein
MAVVVNSLLGLTSARAQQSPRKKIPVVGLLWHAGSQEEEGKYFKALVDGLASLGYVDGRTIKLEHRYPNEQYDRFESYARELVQLRPDVLVGVTPPAALALQRTGTSISLIFLIVPDPVAAKLVQSLSRPGGNITGFSNVSTDLNAKRLQLFKDTVPDSKRIALLINPSNKVVTEKTIADMKAAASALKLEIELVEARDQSEFETAYRVIGRRPIDGLITAIDPLFFSGRARLAELAIQHRLPTMHVNGDAVESGFLMSYGTNHEAIFRRTPFYIDKILRGTSPEALPVEQPTMFELSVNLKTARAIGVRIPQTVMLQASRVFE